MLGKECGRSIWYGWRWAKKAWFEARILRLFNRGHLEEARFIAMLLAIGVQVFQQDEKGNQFRISEIGGHLGGSGDGVGIGVPDVPAGEPCVLEFKTHGEKSFLKLKKGGVRVAKIEHYVQTSLYMRKMKIRYALYAAVNKNTDEIYMEIITLDEYVADSYLQRGREIIFMKQAPDRIPHADPNHYDCMYCNEKDICYGSEKMAHNCRTCMYAEPHEDGTWWCESKERQLAMAFGTLEDVDHTKGETFQLTKERQLTGCQRFHTPI